MVRPRRRSSAHRSGSIPVRTRTRVLLPWSTWPAVATTCTSPALRVEASVAGTGQNRERALHGGQQPVVVGLGYAAGIDQAGAAVDARKHGRIAESQQFGGLDRKLDGPAGQQDPRAAAAADAAVV